MSEYCTMVSDSKKNIGNEKTPINSSLRGAENNTGGGEKYGGQDDSNGYNATGDADELTGAQKMYADLHIHKMLHLISNRYVSIYFNSY